MDVGEERHERAHAGIVGPAAHRFELEEGPPEREGGAIHRAQELARVRRLEQQGQAEADPDLLLLEQVGQQLVDVAFFEAVVPARRGRQRLDEGRRCDRQPFDVGLLEDGLAVSVDRTLDDQPGRPPRDRDLLVAQALERWIAAMNAGLGPDPLVKLYAPDAVLFATQNPALLDTPEGVLGNFDGLADRQKKKGYKAELGRFVTHVFADAAVNTGYYTFSFLEDDGREVVKRYRFSFTYRRAGADWLIVSHHSSPVPEKDLTPRPEKR